MYLNNQINYVEYDTYFLYFNSNMYVHMYTYVICILLNSTHNPMIPKEAQLKTMDQIIQPPTNGYLSKSLIRQILKCGSVIWILNTMFSAIK